MAFACGAANFGGSRPFVAARLGSTQNQCIVFFDGAVSAGVFTHTRQLGAIAVPRSVLSRSTSPQVRRYLTCMKTAVSSKGQIVLPAELRQVDRIEPGQVFDVERPHCLPWDADTGLK